MSRQDRIAPRTPADLERRYNFDKSFAEVMGIATDARNEAQEAKKVASSVAETDEGLKIKVKALDDEMVTVKAELDMSVKTDEKGNLTSKMHIGADLLTIDTGNLELDNEGTLKSKYSETCSAALSEGRVKIVNNQQALFDGTYNYIPLIEFSVGTTHKMVAARLNGYIGSQTWDLCILDGTFFDNEFTATEGEA